MKKEGLIKKKTGNSFEYDFFLSLYKKLPNDENVITILAELHTRYENFNDGLILDRKLVLLKPTDPIAHYNLACSLSLKKKYSESIKSLNKAIALGFSDFSLMFNDNDLSGLRDTDFFLLLKQNLDTS